MKFEHEDHQARPPAISSSMRLGLSLALALAAWCAWHVAPAEAQTQAPMELNVQVGSDGATQPAPGQSGLSGYAQPQPGYGQPQNAYGAPQGATYAPPGQDIYAPVTGQPVSPQGYPAPGQDAGLGVQGSPAFQVMEPVVAPLPIVPADAPPPIPPSLSILPQREPDPEPTTPEEAAALEVKNKIFGKLGEWHSSVMQNYVFNTGLMSDPFMPIESVARPQDTRLLAEQDEERKRRLPLLQRLTLNQFTLSAIVVSADPGATSALLDSGGRSFIVHRGTLIGPNGGYVKEITPNRVIVVEPQVNYRGESQLAETVFRMNVLEDESMEEFKREQGLDG